MQTRLHADRWNKAWAFLFNTDLSQLTVGKHLIDSNRVFALVTEGETKEKSDDRWEIHQHYADIHYVIDGSEEIGMASAKNAKEVKPYDAGKDITFYRLKGRFYHADTSSYFIFFPRKDAHQPGVKQESRLNAQAPEKFKKLVIKISTDN